MNHDTETQASSPADANKLNKFKIQTDDEAPTPDELADGLRQSRWQQAPCRLSGCPASAPPRWNAGYPGIAWKGTPPFPPRTHRSGRTKGRPWCSGHCATRGCGQRKPRDRGQHGRCVRMPWCGQSPCTPYTSTRHPPVQLARAPQATLPPMKLLTSSPAFWGGRRSYPAQ